MWSTRSKRSLTAAVLALVLLVGLAIWKWPRASAVEHTAPPAKETYGPTAAGAPALAANESAEAPVPMSVAAMEKALADYKAVSVYPPWSRPLSDETADKLYWNRTINSELPFDDRPGKDIVYRFGGERWTVPYPEPFVSWIEVLDHGKRIPFRVVSAELVSAKTGSIAAVTYHDDGQDGDVAAHDLRFTNKLIPSKSLNTTAQQVRIDAVIEANGVTRAIMRDFAYAPRKAAEILAAREELRGGNLVVTLDVQVFEKGLYTFDANVMAAADTTPIVFGEKSYPLEPGKRSVEVTMFGRAFAESRIDGPYVVQDIRGMRRFIDTDEQNFYFVYPKTLRTQPYKHDQFSPAEWDAPERTDTIANFERVIAEGRAGMLGKDDDDGKPHPPPTIDPTQEPPPMPPPATKH